MAEQVQKEKSFLEKIKLAEASVEQNRVKLEAKIKRERQTLQRQVEELEQQLIMVKKNRNERI